MLLLAWRQNLDLELREEWSCCCSTSPVKRALTGLWKLSKQSIAASMGYMVTIPIHWPCQCVWGDQQRGWDGGWAEEHDRSEHVRSEKSLRGVRSSHPGWGKDRAGWLVQLFLIKSILGVQVSSGSAPMFVEKCSPEMKEFCVKQDVTWKEVLPCTISASTERYFTDRGSPDQTIPQLVGVWLSWGQDKSTGIQGLWDKVYFIDWQLFGGPFGRDLKCECVIWLWSSYCSQGVSINSRDHSFL